MKISLLTSLLISTTSGHHPVSSAYCAKYPDWGPCVHFLQEQHHQEQVIQHLVSKSKSKESIKLEHQYNQTHQKLKNYENERSSEFISWIYWKDNKKEIKLKKKVYKTEEKIHKDMEKADKKEKKTFEEEVKVIK